MAAIQDDYSQFEKALAVWKDLSLPSVQKQLDSQAVQIKENQTSLLVSRKDLATKTKTFKKLPDSDKLDEIKPLLKAYQNEIDNLTQKSKFVESVFFDLYKNISEAPDPTPLLANALKSFKISSDISFLQLENQELKDKLDRFKDYEIIKSKLIDGEQKHAENLKVKLLLKDDEFKTKLDEIEKSHKLSENDYQRKINSLTKQVSELKALNEISKKKLKAQNLMLNNDEDDDEEDEEIEKSTETTNNNEDNEISLLNKDLQFSKKKIDELEKRNLELKDSLNKVQDSIKNDSTNKKLIEKNLSLEQKNSILLTNSNNDKRNIKKLETELSNLKSQLMNKDSTINDFKTKLVSYKDYEEIKNELNVLRSLEFDVDIDDEKNLDHTLMISNKKLNNELVELRNKNNDLTKKYNGLLKSFDLKIKELENLRKTNEKLENDISNVNNNNNNNTDHWESMSMMSGFSKALPRGNSSNYAPSTRYPSNSGRISPAASIAGFDQFETGVGNNNNNSLLPIITQQRDRFKNKNVELESKLRDNMKLITELTKKNNTYQQKINSLSTEIKFLQSRQQVTNQSSSTPNVTPYGDQFTSSTYDVLLDDYETFTFITNNQILNKLKNLLGSENTKKLDHKLSSLEKFFYGGLKIILMNQYTRLSFIIYWLLIHSLILLSIFSILKPSSISSTSASSSSLSSSTTNSDPILAAVAAVAGGSNNIKAIPKDSIKIA